MDSTRVSEALNPGSIPGEATKRINRLKFKFLRWFKVVHMTIINQCLQRHQNLNYSFYCFFYILFFCHRNRTKSMSSF